MFSGQAKGGSGEEKSAKARAFGKVGHRQAQGNLPDKEGEEGKMREGPPAAVGVEEERGLGDGGVHPQLFPVAFQERNNPVHGLVPKSIPPAVEENSNSPGPGAPNPQRTST